MNRPQPSSVDPRPTGEPAPSQPSYLRRNVLWGMSTLSAVVLGLSYHTSLDPSASAAGAQPSSAATLAVVSPGGTSSNAAPGAGASSASSASGSSASSGSSGSSGSSSSGLKDGTYTGTSVSTRWGNVQVRIVVSGGRITSSQAIAYPTANSKDQQINSRAVPQYNAAAVAAQSAQIDSISGATVTWTGYTASLQSAIDQARA